MKKTFHSRKFLNKSAGMAAIELDGSYSDYSFDCTIAISDCNRRIDLDMYMWDEKSVKEKQNKLDLLIKELSDFRDWIKATSPDYLEGNRNRKKSKPTPVRVTEVTLDDL